ncbi:MAG: hypothetical protein ACP5PM_05810 [Acidimicrobiales bacterium]
MGPSLGAAAVVGRSKVKTPAVAARQAGEMAHWRMRASASAMAVPPQLDPPLEPLEPLEQRARPSPLVCQARSVPRRRQERRAQRSSAVPTSQVPR